MALQNIIRVKPSKPSSRTRVPLHAIDKIASVFTPLNLFFKPSSSGPTQLQDFAGSLQSITDRLPLIAGSIYYVEDVHGVKSKELVDDGRGVDLIWVDSPISYVHPPESVSLMPRNTQGSLETSDETILMVKFTRFICGTLAMCISLSHMFADCASYTDLIKEWARVSRGDFMSEALSISWSRDPGIFFPPPTNIISYDMWLQNEATHSPMEPRPAILTDFFFTWESLRRLKDACTPVNPNAWVSTGDCVAALLWKGLTITRKTLFEPYSDVRLFMAVDGRNRSKMPEASKYFGNLTTSITITVSKSALLEGSVASIALAIRQAIDQQLTEANCANILASFEFIRSVPGGGNLSIISNWTKFPLVGKEIDFGGGAPFWATYAGQSTAGLIAVLPQRDGYLCSLAVETDLKDKLHTIDELLKYAKPTTSI